MKPEILAAGPWYKGNGTVPHRVVLCKWPTGEYSTHKECFDTDISPDPYYHAGVYHRDNFDVAHANWIERMNEQHFHFTHDVMKCDYLTVAHADVTE